MANRVLTAVENILLGLKLSEYHTGYRAYSGQALRTVKWHQNSDDFVFDNQIVAQFRAADLRGNPACMYALIRNWPGGASTDYNRVRHLHLSYDPHGREWGARFVHGGTHHRYAHVRAHRQARG